MSSLVGQTLDSRYVIEEQLGAGGMGVVFKARHAILGTSVAVKILNAEHSADAGLAKRFVREAKHSFALDHPHCVRITDFGAAQDGTLYMVMEHLKGRTIYDELQLDGPMSSRRVAHIGKQVASALLGAHEKGLIHRDLKPANIMLSHKGEDADYVKVFDFGLARLFDQEALGTIASISPLTQDGIVFGTPDYMSPEQALGQELDPSSDVYALGVCLYEMLCGEVPFTGESFMAVLSKHVKDAPPRLTDKVRVRDLNPELEALVYSCLEKKPERRPPLSDIIGALDRISHAPSRPSRSLSAEETLSLSQQIPCANPPGVFGLQGDGSTAVGNAGPRLTEAILVGGARGKGRWLPLAIAAALVAVLALLLLSRSGQSEGESTRAGSRSEAPAIAPQPVAATPEDLAPALIEAADASALPAPIAPDAGGALPDAAAASTELSAPTKPRKAKRAAATNAHLERAEAAHRSGNHLKQLAEANAALAQLPKNRRALYLVGDALLKSGDKVRACTYFKRSSKKHYRAAGCGD